MTQEEREAGEADIVVRLRAEGENALRQHLSLGMHKLCSEAADEIDRLRAVEESTCDGADVAIADLTDALHCINGWLIAHRECGQPLDLDVIGRTARAALGYPPENT